MQKQLTVQFRKKKNVFFFGGVCVCDDSGSCPFFFANTHSRNAEKKMGGGKEGAFFVVGAVFSFVIIEDEVKVGGQLRKGSKEDAHLREAAVQDHLSSFSSSLSVFDP